MNTASEHYARFLAPHYTWMSGGYEAEVPRHRELFAARGISARPGERALDLGCGSGFQTLALAQQGYEVVAVDSSRELLEELRSRSAGHRVTALHGDLFDAAVHASHAPFDVAVCMGDSLLHADSREQVSTMLHGLHDHLRPGGRVVLSFRDLSEELVGLDRFLPVRLDEHRVFTTFLEYVGDRVRVHDMLCLREPGGPWQSTKSVYEKLRLSGAEVVDLLEQAGFTHAARTTDRGFTIVTA